MVEQPDIHDTMKAVLQVVNEGRADTAALRDEIQSGFKKLSEETTEIRKVIDNDTATFKQVEKQKNQLDAMEGLLAEMTKEVRNLTRAVNRAGIVTGQ